MPNPEALNLIRNRKGRCPHIMVVTAEPTPSRIASLALGTGDIDCVYHFALTELREAIIETNNDEALQLLDIIDRRQTTAGYRRFAAGFAGVVILAESLKFPKVSKLA